MQITSMTKEDLKLQKKAQDENNTACIWYGSHLKKQENEPKNDLKQSIKELADNLEKAKPDQTIKHCQDFAKKIVHITNSTAFTSTITRPDGALQRLWQSLWAPIQNIAWTEERIYQVTFAMVTKSEQAILARKVLHFNLKDEKQNLEEDDQKTLAAWTAFKQASSQAETAKQDFETMINELKEFNSKSS